MLRKFTLRRDFGSVKGSFKISEAFQRIAVSEGETVRERYVKVRFDKSRETYAIIQETRKHYIIHHNNKEVAIIKFDSMFNLDQLIIVTAEEEKIRILRQDRGDDLPFQKYVFFYGKLIVGFLSAPNWNHVNVDYEFDTSFADEIIHCAVALLASLKPIRIHE